MSSPTYGPMTDDDLPAAARLITHAFAGTIEGATEWLRDAGLEHVRILREAGAPLACLLRIPMGQFFGGRSVPMLGIAGVAVAPESRGRGLARRLMEEAVREMHAEGWPISCLYASTQTLYRQVGYEQAGHRFMIRLPLASIDIRERGGAIVPLGPDDEPGVIDCYREFAAANDGWLDRGAYCWRRVHTVRGESFHGFGIPRAGQDAASPRGLDGYVFLSQRRKPETGRHDLILSDLAFRTAAAGRRLLGFLADFATVGDDAIFYGGPHHPLLWLLGHPRAAVTLKDYWMVRVVDVAKALEARGWPEGPTSEFTFRVADDLLTQNCGEWTVRVSGNGAAVRRGAPADSAGPRVGVGALAALYTGFMSPAWLAHVGAAGSESAARPWPLAGTPAMPDQF